MDGTSAERTFTLVIGTVPPVERTFTLVIGTVPSVERTFTLVIGTVLSAERTFTYGMCTAVGVSVSWFPRRETSCYSISRSLRSQESSDPSEET